MIFEHIFQFVFKNLDVSAVFVIAIPERDSKAQYQLITEKPLSENQPVRPESQKVARKTDANPYLTCISSQIN